MTGTPEHPRPHLIAPVLDAKRSGGYAFLNDEGNPKGPCRPQDVPADATAVYGPSPRVVRGSQYLRRLRRLHNARKDHRPLSR